MNITNNSRHQTETLNKQLSGRILTLENDINDERKLRERDSKELIRLRSVNTQFQ